MTDVGEMNRFNREMYGAPYMSADSEQIAKMLEMFNYNESKRKKILSKYKKLSDFYSLGEDIC